MNPHHLFLAITIFSLAVTLISLTQAEDADAIHDMAMPLGITGASAGLVLYVTRKFWRDARRLV